MKDFTSLVAPEARHTIWLNDQLGNAVSNIVPVAAVDAIALCRIEKEQLHITLTSASWLSRLRFSERALLEEVVKLGQTATTVRWHVLPGRVEPQRRESIRQAALEIPGEAPGKLLAAAQQFDDEGLRKALIRVAKTMQKRLDEKQQRKT